jgi:hypothetical protein
MFRASLWQRGQRFDPGRDPRFANKAPTIEARQFPYAMLNFDRNIEVAESRKFAINRA